MRTHTITLNQRTYNRVCQQLDFTEKNGNSGRYVVGTKNLYNGINPSLDTGDADGFGSLQSLIAQAIENGESVGGWMDTTTGIYYVDCVAMTNELHVAKTLGHENDELCVWDSHREETIDIYKQSSPSEPDAYPFQNGDYYWYEATYHDGTRAIEHGIWDITSECSHDRNPFQRYYTASEVLMKAREQGVPIKTGCN
jgi:hypothetical protein